MKTTLTINVAGVAFVIDNDAYTLLSTYLETIEARLSASTSSLETYQDIESRVAELFTQMGASTVRVVSIENVREVIKAIGSPEIFGDADFNTSSANFSNKGLKRRILRDPRDKSIGGVCKAISVYLNTDSTVVKIIFLLAFIFGGSGILAYIILWIVIPEAKSVEDFEILDRMKNGTI